MGDNATLSRFSLAWELDGRGMGLVFIGWRDGAGGIGLRAGGYGVQVSVQRAQTR